jgi:hypothetical protein
MAIPSRCARGTNCSLGAVVVVLGDAQGDGAVVDDGEAPGASLRLVAGLVIDLGGDGVYPLRQAHAGRVGKAVGGVDLRGDDFAVQQQRGAHRLDARAGLRIIQRGGDDRPGAGGHRAVGRDGVGDDGWLAVIGYLPFGGCRVKRGVQPDQLSTLSAVWTRTQSYFATRSELIRD